jgi:hypothetical protein
LTYFEIGAQCAGLGTLWNGLAKMALNLLPDMQTELQIPEGSRVAFTMSFGWPAVSYARSAQYEPVIRSIGC